MFDAPAYEPAPPAAKTDAGRFFEDFRLGETLRHATPRTLTNGDAALYMALHAPRHALFCSAPFAAACGVSSAPLNPWLVFHTVFGKTVADVSLNAVANLGYAEGRWLRPVRAGDTLTARSEVIGLKETSRGDSGVVYVRTTGFDQDGEPVLSYVRWVLVKKRDAASPPPIAYTPTLAPVVAACDLVLPHGLDFRGYDFDAAGAPHVYEDYAAGERIDHVAGMAVEEAEAQMATRLYQNTARVHFDAHGQAAAGGRRLVYGGVVISTAAALAYDGLENAGLVLALNGGRHANPFHAGRTIYAWTEVRDRAVLDAERRIGALRLRLVATADRPCADFPGAEGPLPPEVLLDLDYWAAIPMRL